MAYVITQNCCSDASCLAACPVGCIHPRPDEPGFGTAEILHIDPEACIDCGACADVCPVDAILPDTGLRDDQRWFAEANARYFADHPMSPTWDTRKTPLIRRGVDGLRVAVVGSGAAAWYAARSLLRHPGVEVTMFDKLPVPGGLVEFGVAPDHPSTKAAMAQFRWMRDQQSRFRLRLNVDVGTDLTHADLMRHHHAVVYAHGSQQERQLGVLGEEFVTGALSFVSWYNDHPHAGDFTPNLRGRRAMIVGNGNVALDMARILATAPDALAGTGIAPRALAELRDSLVEEVVIVGRRGPTDAAFTAAELHGLMQTGGIDVVVDPADLVGAPPSATVDLLRAAAAAASTPGARRIVLRFNTVVERVTPSDDGGVSVTLAAPGGQTDIVDATVLLRAVGFRGTPIVGVPFSIETGTIPNDDNRVVDPDTGAVIPGVYATGWIARGPNGGIGINRSCAEAAAEHLMDDYAAGALGDHLDSGFPELLRNSCPRVVMIDGARGYADAVEQANAYRRGCPSEPRTLLAVARGKLLPLWPRVGRRSGHRAPASAGGSRS
ncbi:MAG: FAD-dependent oxidoreductase [Mycobacterium kyogaense]|uniref:FAD-dependent oxidoreductase n=1 Tax=Mycobacterium kyogaense TaxID=2212479 RepID=UPI002FF52880